MTIYQMPPQDPPGNNGEGKIKSSDSQSHIEEPEVIIIDPATEEGGQRTTIHPERSAKGSIFYKLFFVVLGGCAAIWAFILIALTVLVGVIAACFLFKNPRLNAVTNAFWKLAKLVSAIATGLVISIFSLNLGLTLILIYLSGLEDSLKSSILASTVRSYARSHTE